MRILLLTVKLYAPWVHSLKEKRSEVKGLLARLKHTFNVSACETDAQDVHQTIVISVVAIAADSAQGDSMGEHILADIQRHTDAEIVDIVQEYR